MALITNLVAYYKCDETSGNLADSSGGGFTLVNIGVCGFGGGKLNGAVDGGSANTTKRFEIANNLGITGGSITINGWVNITTAPAAAEKQRLFEQDDLTNDNGYFAIYQNTGGTLQMFFERIRNSVADDSFTVTQTLTVGAWNMITLTYDGATVTGYVNATAVGTVASTGAGVGNTDDFTILGANGGTQNVKGLMDEVGVWSRALSGNEVTQLYNQGAGLTYPFDRPSFSYRPGLRPHAFSPGRAR